MTTDELIKALERMKSETGSLADSLCCLGCGHEHNCGVHGCAVIREAIKTANLYQAAYKCSSGSGTATHAFTTIRAEWTICAVRSAREGKNGDGTEEESKHEHCTHVIKKYVLVYATRFF